MKKRKEYKVDEQVGNMEDNTEFENGQEDKETHLEERNLSEGNKLLEEKKKPLSCRREGRCN